MTNDPPPFPPASGPAFDPSHGVPPAYSAPPPRRRPRWPWFLLLGLVLLCGAGVWAAQQFGKTVMGGMEGTSDEGKTAGQGQTQAACFDLAHARYDDASPMQAPGAVGFVMGCLETATASPKMCEGVPAGREAGQAWARERCGTRMGCAAIEGARLGACGAVPSDSTGR